MLLCFSAQGSQILLSQWELPPLQTPKFFFFNAVVNGSEENNGVLACYDFFKCQRYEFCVCMH